MSARNNQENLSFVGLSALRGGQESVWALSKRAQTNDPAWYVSLFICLTAVGMGAMAAIDIALNYSIMKAAFTNELGQSSLESTAGLWFGSAVMLVGYWGVGALYTQSFEMRRFAYIGYAGMLLILSALLFPVQSQQFNDMWASLAMSDALHPTAGQIPVPLMVVFVGLTALLYSGPGLFFVWLKGRFVFWIERCRILTQAKKTIRLAEEANGSEEVFHQAALLIEHLSDPQQRAKLIRSALRLGLSAYASEVERRATEARNAQLDVCTPKALKQLAEQQYDAAMHCKASIQTITV